jgi:PAS domain S-box-containing protein
LEPDLLSDPRISRFLYAVNSAYAEYDAQRVLLERAAEDANDALTEQNAELLNDIEARKAMEAQLRDTESKWQSLVEASPSIILTLGPGNVITSSNRNELREGLCVTGPNRPDFLVWPNGPGEMLEIVWTSRKATISQTEVWNEDGTRSLFEVQVLPIFAFGRVIGLTLIAKDITERMATKEALRRTEDQFRAMFQNAPLGMAVTTPAGLIDFCNPSFSRMLGRSFDELHGLKLADLVVHEERNRLHDGLMSLWTGQQSIAACEVRYPGPEGTVTWGRTLLVCERDPSGQPRQFAAMVEDITEQKRNAEREAMIEAQLRQSQKMESIGQLAAGIAHEINTPTQFIGDNLVFLERALGILLPAAEKSRDTIPKYDYLAKQTPRAIEQSLEGCRRVASIVRAMKEFAHPSGVEQVAVDLQHILENTAIVSRNEWKYVAELETDFEPKSPHVFCYADELAQVFLNMIVNAAHAVSEVPRENGALGKIRISTRAVGQTSEIRISDDGCGIPQQNIQKIFDLFFTTKPVGKGSGQGLALAHSVIVKKHQGTIEVESAVGKGTTFIIRLPINGCGETRKAG